ncbi:Uncharacterised protein [Mycoplasmoides pneumoniae]|uniref:Uncharacterized protein n=1 Tax=Mycoplasmoides pneumoniae TaxID=2104 RepID=A0AB38W8L2_MYCPM|nr:Uncharacterised protein [Mycoplasmoides pneumoniae]
MVKRSCRSKGIIPGTFAFGGGRFSSSCNLLDGRVVCLTCGCSTAGCGSGWGTGSTIGCVASTWILDVATGCWLKLVVVGCWNSFKCTSAVWWTGWVGTWLLKLVGSDCGCTLTGWVEVCGSCLGNWLKDFTNSSPNLSNGPKSNWGMSLEKNFLSWLDWFALVWLVRSCWGWTTGSSFNCCSTFLTSWTVSASSSSWARSKKKRFFLLMAMVD